MNLMRTTCKMHVRKTAVSAVADIPPHNRPQRSLRLRHLQISVYPYFRDATRVMDRERRRLESHPLPAGMCAFSRGLLPGAAGAPRRRRNWETLPRTRNPPTAPTLPKNFTARVSRLHGAAAVCAQLPQGSGRAEQEGRNKRSRRKTQDANSFLENILHTQYKS